MTDTPQTFDDCLLQYNSEARTKLSVREEQIAIIFWNRSAVSMQARLARLFDDRWSLTFDGAEVAAAIEDVEVE